ncbi:bifunctional DNA primase/polymerase [Plantactinospora sonchi]|uniref:Bifunctional DNA primase/polymerase n=1 Tax=Plantactinospora sonchi TaxID=1544735 RepID=A0ABU7RZN1_9ACTN
MTPLLHTALAYAAGGVPVLPLHNPTSSGCSCGRADCDRPGKHPRWHQTLLRHGLHDATTRPDRIRRWWARWPEANVGLRTGIRFDVCDVDAREAVPRLRELFRDAPVAGPLVRTGSGGWHLYLRPTGAGNRTALLPGVDWRGVGGYVVAPPSRHASGARYRWVRRPAAPLPDCPVPLAALLRPPSRTVDRHLDSPARGHLDGCAAGAPDGAGPVTRVHPGPPGQPAGIRDREIRRPDRYADAALVAEAELVAHAAVGTRNTTLFRAAYHLGQLAAVRLLDEHSIAIVLADAAYRAGLDRPEIDRTIRSGLRTGRRRPRPGLAA